MNKPIIGISGNERPHAKFPDITWSYTPSGYVKGVQEAGGLPLVIPISDPSFAEYYVSMIDKLILTGGQNVDPVFMVKTKIQVITIFIWRVIYLSLLSLKKRLSKKNLFFLFAAELN